MSQTENSGNKKRESVFRDAANAKNPVSIYCTCFLYFKQRISLANSSWTCSCMLTCNPKIRPRDCPAMVMSPGFPLTDILLPLGLAANPLANHNINLQLGWPTNKLEPTNILQTIGR